MKSKKEVNSPFGVIGGKNYMQYRYYYDVIYFLYQDTIMDPSYRKMMEVVTMKSNTNNTAKLMEKLARKSLELAAESRCMYIYHQPKMPAELKQFKK